MKLSKLLRSLDASKIHYKVDGRRDVLVTGISDNSTKINTGNLFVAIKGLHTDAHKLVPEALKKGAVAVVGERSLKLNGATYIKVDNSRQALSVLASSWYANPNKQLKMVGVTGTKGKTTVSYVLYHILNFTGKKVGLISSVAAKIGDKSYETGLHVTNPEPLMLQRFLKEMVDSGCEIGIVEVTSHGLEQDRVFGINFDYGILTNIAPEHLDYHKTLLNYKKAKLKLFLRSKVAILNKSDNSYNFFTTRLSPEASSVSYGIGSGNYSAENVRLGGQTAFDVVDGKTKHRIFTPLQGKYNVENIMAAIVCARLLGVNWQKITTALKYFPQIPGRLEEIPNNLGISIYIDFAHTPESLEAVLTYLRSKTKNKLIAVFGCASERDVLKRPKMGKISTKLADVSVFTAEDSRYEPTSKIIDEIASGVKRGAVKEMKLSDNFEKANRPVFTRIPERGRAIYFAVQQAANKGDTVVICGKGVETSMAYKGIEYPWLDKKAVEYALKGKILEIKR